MSRRQALDIPVEGLPMLAGIEQKARKGVLVNGAGNSGKRQEAAQGRGEGEEIAHAAIVERPKRKRVGRGKEPAFARMPGREGEFALQVFRAAFVPFEVGAQNQFAVGKRTCGVWGQPECMRELVPPLQQGIGDHRHAAIGAAQRLPIEPIFGYEVASQVGQARRILTPVRDPIRRAYGHQPNHPADFLRTDRDLVETDDPSEAAHESGDDGSIDRRDKIRIRGGIKPDAPDRDSRSNALPADSPQQPPKNNYGLCGGRQQGRQRDPRSNKQTLGRKAQGYQR